MSFDICEAAVSTLEVRCWRRACELGREPPGVLVYRIEGQHLKILDRLGGDTVMWVLLLLWLIPVMGWDWLW